MNELELLEKAIAIAIDAHRGRKDRYDAPYILHPLRVMARLQSATEKTVAILHDVIEDTDWTFEDLREEGFPQQIVDALDCLTKREGEPYEKLITRSASNALARRVKIADLEDNMDLRRFPVIAPKDTARLRKYLAAWQALSSIK